MLTKSVYTELRVFVFGILAFSAAFFTVSFCL